MTDFKPEPRPGPGPDLMNDPDYQTNAKGKEKSVDEQDTCRICRGEGSKEEPLFYPCKCSGSIKFVHQDCLMEWLSHSQKKHCELCKTPFRFTKLYHPQMPTTVPLPVFIRQAGVHTVKTLARWARIILVVFVWVLWLPWCMRTVWRGLFWIGDGGWINWQAVQNRSLSLARTRIDDLAKEGTTPARPELLLSKDVAVSAVISRVSAMFPPILLPVSQTLNITGGESMVVRLAKRLYHVALGQSSNSSAPINFTIAANASAGIGLTQRAPSWLSDITFLRYLTRWKTLNNIVIDTLEGQLITLLVVVTFILIFLIREWVVQQQPGFDMGLGGNAGFIAARNGEEAPAQEQPHHRHVEHRPDLVPQEEAANVAGHPVNRQAEPGRLPRILVRPRARPQVQPEQGEEQNAANQQDAGDNELGTPDLQHHNPLKTPLNDLQIEQSVNDVDAGPSNTNQRPSMPTRDALTRATEIQRTIEEHSRASGQDWPGLEVFMDLWKRADSNPSEVLKIIESEGTGEDLGWIVAAMRRLEDSSATDKTLQNSPDSGSSQAREGQVNEQQSDHSNDSWQVVGKDPSQTRDVPTEAVQRPSLSTSSNSQGLTNAETLQVTANHGSATPVHDEQRDEGSTEFSDKEEFQRDLEQNDNRTEVITTPINALGKQSHMVPNREVLQPDDHAPTIRQAINYLASESEADPSRPLNPALQGSLNQASASQSDITHLVSRGNAPNPIPPTQGLGERVTDWLWGGVAPAGIRADEHGEDDEHVINEAAEEPPFVPIAQGQPVFGDNHAAEHPGQDPDVVRAAAEAGIDPNDPEAVEDGEDLEGVMELIGMQGPLAGLIQNCMFSAVLISMTVFFGIWVPYIAGKVFLVFLANPVSLLVKMPLRWASTIADLIIDTSVFITGCAFYWVDTIVTLACTPVGWLIPLVGKMNEKKVLAATAKSYAQSALERLAKMFVATGDSLSDSDIPVFSIIAHESLHNLEQRLANLLNVVTNVTITAIQTTPVAFDLNSGYIYIFKSLTSHIKELGNALISKTYYTLAAAPSLLLLNPLHISLDIPHRTSPLNYNLAYWNTQDRIVAIILGYAFFAVVGALYLKIMATFRDGRSTEKAEGSAADILYQAGGVLKVILIISIEMIVFPLYCGLLLDMALLPLFENATAISRVTFMLTSPATSLFVHWFVGTCYMFHFALFVSMCRKIMRSGVLYFIRDPDDPTFHPVRDVLERSVTTQLRKIAFSALVYGALIGICLGAVVWGLATIFREIFPIHWSSNEPVLEFPVDLLFYNFLMPLAVKFFRPSKGLDRMYAWWFLKCSRRLRLTNFLFGLKRKDEEGYHIRRTWWDLFIRKEGDVEHPIIGDDRRALAEDCNTSVYFFRDGKYVRAPASDQVRIPKGANTFVEVNEEGERVDGLPNNVTGLHGRDNKLFETIYIPPFFRLRICALIFLIWVFAATTGVGITIIPLIFGRFVFTRLIPAHPRMNDIYAFSIGIYLLGAPLYLVLHYHTILHGPLSYWRRNDTPPPVQLLHNCTTYVLRLFRLVYFYTSFTVLLPSLFALVMEAYLVIPLHTYFSNGGTTERHVIHFIQDWTLGVLYVKIAGRLVLWNENTRPAQALRAIVHNGWLDPDTRLATRSFILPVTVLMALALALPLPLGWLANQAWWFSRGMQHQQDREIMRAVIYRYSYPAMLCLVLGVLFCMVLRRAVSGWRMKIRDEVYLIGERLHNFGEKRVGGGGGAGGKVVAGRRVR